MMTNRDLEQFNAFLKSTLAIMVETPGAARPSASLHHMSDVFEPLTREEAQTIAPLPFLSSSSGSTFNL